MRISEIITDKYKLRIPPTVYYELLADVQELEEEQEPTTKNDLAVDLISRAQAQTKIEMNASRYTIAKERGGMGQVEWSDQLIKVSEAVDIIRNLPSVTPQEPCEDVISRKSIKQKLQEHHDFFVNAYGGFSNLPQNDKSRVDEITNCIAMVVNEPPVIPQEPITWIVGKNNAQIAVKNMPIDKLQKICAIIGGEQESVLDKIRAEIKNIDTSYYSSVNGDRLKR